MYLTGRENDSDWARPRYQMAKLEAIAYVGAFRRVSVAAVPEQHPCLLRNLALRSEHCHPKALLILEWCRDIIIPGQLKIQGVLIN